MPKKLLHTIKEFIKFHTADYHFITEKDMVGWELLRSDIKFSIARIKRVIEYHSPFSKVIKVDINEVQ